MGHTHSQTAANTLPDTTTPTDGSVKVRLSAKTCSIVNKIILFCVLDLQPRGVYECG
jgi:hypothetical protein